MKRTKTKLISSITVLIVCFAMLIGSTFAWFTDSASTGVNTIQAGNLDIKVEYLSDLANDTWTEVDVNKKLFNDNALWEPGYAEVAYLKITNAGNLHLRYKLSVNTYDNVTGTSVNGDTIDLSTILKFGKIESPTAPSPYSKNSAGRAQAIAAVSGNATPLTAYSKENLDLAPGASEYVTLVVYMPSTVGNEANYRGGSAPSIKLGLDVVATQAIKETDSFNDQYDKDALYPILASVINNTKGESVALDESGNTGNEEIQIIDTNATSKIPENTTLYADDGSTAVATNDRGTLNREIRTTESSIDSVTYDISYKYIAQNGTSTDVTKFSDVVENIINVSTGLNVVKVTHSHGTTTTEMTPANNLTTKADGTYYYDSQNGKIYVWSSLYSSFKVEYENDFVAATDGQGYGTLNEALTAVKDNGTVILLKDITLNKDLQIGTGSKNINLNLNNKTIDGGSYQIYTAGIGIVTIYGDGVIKNNNTSQKADCAPLGIYIGSNVVLDGVSIEGIYCGVKNSGNLTVLKANITADTFGIGLFGSGETTIGQNNSDNDITVLAEEQAIATASATGKSDMVVNVYGGVFETTGTEWDDCPIYWAGHGTLNVYGGSFISDSSGNVAALYQKNGTVRIYDGSFKARNGIKVAAEETNTTEISLDIFGGNIIGTRHAALYYKTTSSDINCNDFNINISGGKFTGDSVKGSFSKSLTGNITPRISVTGGSYSSNPIDYLEDGFCAVPNGEYYEVVEGVRNISDLRTIAKSSTKTINIGSDIYVNDVQTYTNSKGLLLNQAKNHTYNFGNKKIIASEDVTADFGLLIIGNLQTNIIINANQSGGIDSTAANAYCIDFVGNYSTAKLTINGGTYKGVTSAVQVQKGTCTINDGFFEVEGDAAYLLNIVDQYRSSSRIIVKGGTFVNFNPANNTAEGEGTNFVADGYKVITTVQSNNDTWYTVVPE